MQTAMQTKPVMEFDASEVKAVREFLTSLRDEQRSPRGGSIPLLRGDVPVRNGIARARMRSSARKASA
jgi:hypothetical protein